MTQQLKMIEAAEQALVGAVHGQIGGKEDPGKGDQEIIDKVRKLIDCPTKGYEGNTVTWYPYESDKSDIIAMREKTVQLAMAVQLLTGRKDVIGLNERMSGQLQIDLDFTAAREVNLPNVLDRLQSIKDRTSGLDRAGS